MKSEKSRSWFFKLMISSPSNTYIPNRCWTSTTRVVVCLPQSWQVRIWIGRSGDVLPTLPDREGEPITAFQQTAGFCYWPPRGGWVSSLRYHKICHGLHGPMWSRVSRSFETVGFWTFEKQDWRFQYFVEQSPK